MPKCSRRDKWGARRSYQFRGENMTRGRRGKKRNIFARLPLRSDCFWHGHRIITTSSIRLVGLDGARGWHRFYCRLSNRYPRVAEQESSMSSCHDAKTGPNTRSHLLLRQTVGYNLVSIVTSEHGECRMPTSKYIKVEKKKHNSPKSVVPRFM